MKLNGPGSSELPVGRGLARAGRPLPRSRVDTDYGLIREQKVTTGKFWTGRKTKRLFSFAVFFFFFFFGARV
jgi:hypothetical protein